MKIYSFWTSGLTRTALGTVLLSTTAMAQPVLAADATILKGIVVEGKSLPALITSEPGRTDMAPAADGGSFLKSIPGVDAVRIGGHGLDPVIRGQQQDQLNIISDGAFMYGGCPSRMDPPTALSSIDSYDSVTVEKGYQSVSHGPGGSGGAVIMERKAPALDEQKPYEIKFGVGGGTNGSTYNSNLGVAYKLGDGYARATGSKSHAANYDDGAGKEVRSAFDQWAAGLELGWTPNDLTELSVGVDRDRMDDVLFSGAGMDSPYGVTDVVRFKFKKDIEGGALQSVRINAYDSRVDHLMDNYSLRTVGAMLMRAPSTSNTQGFKVEGDVDVADIPVLLGLDYKTLDRTAIRYRGTNVNNVTTLQSYLWPGVSSREIGVFGEGVKKLDDARSVKLGVRYDNVHVTADKANETASYTGALTRTANQLYSTYYGYSFQTVTENNLSGLARYEQKLDQDTTTYVTLSRSVRTASTSERTIAADHGTASMRQIGNVRLNPEKHYQVDVGVDTTLGGYAVTSSLYYDRVNDYIFRDVARGQSGILLSDSAVVYRNIDANLMGLDLSAGRTFDNQLSLLGSLSFTRGENEDTNGPLAQVPPLKMTMDVSYPTFDWVVGMRANAAAKQTRVDDSTATGSGRDVGKTSGYLTADLYGSRSLYDNFELGLGVTNVFDKVYANHLNKSNSFDTTETQVNEPGRSFYLRLTGTF